MRDDEAVVPFASVTMVEQPFAVVGCEDCGRTELDGRPFDLLDWVEANQIVLPGKRPAGDLPGRRC